MRSWLLIIVVLFVSLSLAGCGGSKAKSVEPEKVETGSLIRTYKLLDDQGRESGTLTINPLGGAELRDMDGNVIGSFTSAGAPSEPEVKKSAETPVEEKAVADEELEPEVEKPAETPVEEKNEG